MTEFSGTLLDEAMVGGLPVEVHGRYGWLDEGSANARIAGEFPVLRETPGDIFLMWGNQKTYRGKSARLSIPGVGLSPVRLYSDGVVRDDRTTRITFEARLPPVPIATRAELAQALWTPIADALEEAGHPDLAGLARAASVALIGFPKTPKEKKG